MPSIKLLSSIGVPLGVVAAAGLVAVPAQAATTINAKVVSATKVEFTATKGKVDTLTVTRSGRTITFDNKVTVKAGKGCKAVKNDVTKVTCTTSQATTWVTVSLGDKNDSVRNNTDIGMSVWAGAGNDSVTGGPKNDYLHGGAGADRIWGSVGNDHVYGDAGNDLLDGGVGNDEVEGAAGDDEIDGRSGDDLLMGRNGDDIINDGAGIDRVYGGGDDDVLVQSNQLGGLDNDMLSGGTGFDGVSYELRVGPVTADLDGESGDDGEAGEGDTIRSDVEGLLGGGADDVLTGSSSTDVLFGFDGGDTLNGGGGDDLLWGFDGADNLDGGTNGVEGDFCDIDSLDIARVNCEHDLGLDAAGTLSGSILGEKRSGLLRQAEKLSRHLAR